MLETVHPRDFLDQIFLDFDIETIRWRRDRKGFTILNEFQIKAFENIRDQIGRQCNTDHFFRSFLAQDDRLANREIDHLVNDRADNRLAF